MEILALAAAALALMWVATQPKKSSTLPSNPPDASALPPQDPSKDVLKEVIGAGAAAVGAIVTAGGTAGAAGGTAATTAAVAAGKTAAAAGGTAAGAVSAGAGAALVGPIAAALLPAGYIVGFIAGAEIAKAQERGKDAQSRFLWLAPNAAGLNTVEVAMVQEQLKSWGVTSVQKNYRDPRMNKFSRGSSVVLQGYRVQLVSLTPDVLSNPLWTADLSALVGRARQAAMRYLDTRSYYAAKAYKSLVPSASAGTFLSFDFTTQVQGSPYEADVPGAGGLQFVPDVLSGPANWPTDPDALPQPSNLRPSFGGSVLPANDCPIAVMEVASVWALRDVVAACANAWPGGTAQQLHQRLGNGPALRASGDWLVLEGYRINGVAPSINAYTADIRDVPDTITSIVPQATGYRTVSPGFIGTKAKPDSAYDGAGASSTEQPVMYAKPADPTIWKAPSTFLKSRKF